jgi:membrane associated rhomboid family serine protease
LLARTSVVPAMPPLLFRRTVLRQILQRPAYTVRLLWAVIVVNWIVFFAELGVGGFADFSANPLFGPSRETLLEFGAVYEGCLRSASGLWRIPTCMVLHVGVLHIALTTLLIAQTGFSLERAYGLALTAAVYVAGGLGGGISAAFFTRFVSAGASGAVYGLQGGVLVDLLVNWKLVTHRGRTVAQFALLLAVSLLIGLFPMVDNFAHLGGLVSGALVALALFPRLEMRRQTIELRRQSAWRRAALILLLVGAWAAMLVVLLINEAGSEACSGCRYLSCLPVSNWCDPPELTASSCSS